MDVEPRGDVIALPLRRGGTAAAILGLVRKQVEDKVEYLMSGLRDNIEDALFEEMLGLDEQAAMSHHFNIMRAVKVDEAAYQEKFQEEQEQLWLNFFEGWDDEHITPLEGELAELVKPLAKRVTNHYKVLIQETRHRFQTLLGREVTDHPLVPEVYYRVFWDALGTMELSDKEKAYLLPLFHRFVMDRYGQVLSVANRTLIDLKVDVTVQLPTSSQ